MSRRFRPFLRGLLALALLAGAPAFAQSAAIASTNPATLDYGNLRTAWIAVNLTGATYENAADTSHFALTTTIPGLTVNRLWFNGGRTGAILYLRWDRSDFNAAATISVTVAAAATTHSAELTTGTVAVSPVRWVNVSAKTVALAEGGSAGSYTVALASQPTGDVSVAVASDNAAVEVDTDATPLTRTLTFTMQNWATAQTVAVTPVDDNADTVDELALVTNVATGGGYASSAVANRTVRVTVADDDTRTGTDYDADDDQLIEIDSLAKLNAVRWDLDGDGAVAAGNATAYAAAFPGAAAGMGCPDSGDADALGNCAGYELTTDLDFDTDGDGSTWTETGGVVGGDDGDAYYDAGAGWEPIGNNVSPPSNYYRAVFRGNGHVVSNLFVNRPEGSSTRYVGLFGVIGGGGRIESLGLRDGYVRAMRAYAGVLAGWSYGDVVGCYSTGTASVGASHHQHSQTSGGLLGAIGNSSVFGAGSLAASYSIARVSTDVCGDRQCARIAGGLVAQAFTSGGTVTIDNSWAAGPVNHPSVNTGGLLGQIIGGNTFTANSSYYDTQTTGWTTSPGGVGLDTADLQQPTGYTGIYINWDDVDLDGDGRVDADDEDAWDFGTSSQYPSLKWGGHDPTRQFALPPPEPQELSRIPTEVQAQTTSQGLLVTWRAAIGATAYLVQWRQSGEAWSSQRQAETTETRYEIGGLPAGAYEVRVLAVVDGEVGEPSAPARGESGVSNRPPQARDIADMTLDVGGTAQVDLDATFSDPDGDALRYAASADGNAVEARVSGGTLRLRGLRPGEATVTVTATDSEGLSASATFTVRVGAMLSLHGNPAVPEGGVVALRAELSRPLASDVEVGWRLAPDGDSATADADEADFGAWAGTATIAAGETRTQIVVAVLDDEEIEPARERFAVELVESADDNVGLSVRAWRVLGSVQEGVCDRTPAVRTVLSRGWRACHWPRPSDLAGRATLDLRGAVVESLRSDDLLGLSGLRTLDLGGNALRDLPTTLLSHSPRLRSLRLDGNRLQSLPAGLFAGVSGLQELRLSGNPGAPFALVPELRRSDAEPWAAGPATVEAALPLGAPFAMRLTLTAVGSEASAEELTLAAGAVASGAAQVSGDGPVRLSLAAPTIPDTRCDDDPCYDGLAAQGATLALFAAPPSVAGDVAPTDLLAAGDARLDLSAHFATGGGGALSYSATVDDPRLATVSVEGAVLTMLANEDGEEGVATVTIVATDDFGQTATLRFQVEVSPGAPGRWRGWRSTIVPSAAAQEAVVQ